MGVERAAAELDLTVRWVPFPLHPETPQEGRSLEDLFAGTGLDLHAMRRKLRSVASELGLTVGERSHTYNSRLAQELAEWAEGEGRGDAFRDAAYRAYFAEGENLAREGVLVETAARAGLPEDEARRVIRERTFADTVDAHWRRAAALGIRAVPTHRFGGAASVGYQRYPELFRFLVAHGASGRRPGSGQPIRRTPPRP